MQRPLKEEVSNLALSEAAHSYGERMVPSLPKRVGEGSLTIRDTKKGSPRARTLGAPPRSRVVGIHDDLDSKRRIRGM